MNRFNLEALIVYQDNRLIVVNKPEGLLVIPTPKNERHTLTNLINQFLKEKKFEIRAHPCHRLDRDTSGLVIYALGKKTQQMMMQRFHRLEVKKAYIAFIHGNLARREGVINIPLEHREAITKYKVLQTREDFSIIEIQPVTGRTNQIRIHFKLIGHPIVGESRFAFRKDFALRFKRLCLHAARLEFKHPITNSLISLSLDLPKDMQRFLDENS